MRKGSFLLTRPNHEPTVNYLFAWAKGVLESSKKKNIFSIDLAESSANKKQFVSSVKKFKPIFIFLNGHGSQNSVLGFDNKPILSFADNEEITKDSVVYALSCQSAKRLGKSCVSQGARSYLGYDDDFIFVFDEKSEGSPAERDKTASYFLDPSNNLAENILEGKTSGEAIESSQSAFEQSIIKFSLSDATAEERDLLPYLLWDREHQVCLGDVLAKCEFISEEQYNKQRTTKLYILISVLIFLIIFLLVLYFGDKFNMLIRLSGSFFSNLFPQAN